MAEDTNTVNISNNINYHLCLSSPLLDWLDTRMDWPGQIGHLISSFISRGLEYTINMQPCHKIQVCTKGHKRDPLMQKSEFHST